MKFIFLKLLAHLVSEQFSLAFPDSTSVTLCDPMSIKGENRNDIDGNSTWNGRNKNIQVGMSRTLWQFSSRNEN